MRQRTAARLFCQIADILVLVIMERRLIHRVFMKNALQKMRKRLWNKMQILFVLFATFKVWERSQSFN
jgi:hypothetical protein